MGRDNIPAGGLTATCMGRHDLPIQVVIRSNFPPGPWAVARRHPLERFPITWNHAIEKESRKIKELEHVLIEKVEQLFWDML